MEAIKEKIDVVTATPNDARAYEEVTRQSWLVTFPNEEYHITREDIEERFSNMSERVAQLQKRMMDPSQDHTYLLAKIGEKVVGVCRVVRRENDTEIQNFFLIPEKTGSGIARKLLNRAFEVAGPEKELMLRVATYNQSAVEFWKHVGFEETEDVISQPLGVKSGATRPMMKMVRKNVR